MAENKRIQAIVLAGGFGSRLFPLTKTKPKPLVRILDVSVLENVLDKLLKINCDSIVVSTHYKSQMIEEVCKEKYSHIKCKREAVPLGTAGGTKNCYDGKSDAVIVVSGDAVFDFDLKKALDFHVKNENEVTIVCSRKENPTELGVILADDDGKIQEIQEKPSWKKVKSDFVNTGIYVLSKYALDCVPDNLEYDFSKNLFPKLLKEGRKVMAFEDAGFWCDVGTFEEYYACNRLAAENKAKMSDKDGKSIKNLQKKGIHADENVYISEDVKIGKNVSVTDKSVVCGGSVLNDNCDISAAIIGRDCFVGDGTSIAGAILGDGIRVGSNCVVPEGCVIGDGCNISEGTVLKKYTKLVPETKISERENMGFGFSERNLNFVNDGCAVFKSASPEEFVKFSDAVSSALKKRENQNICIGVMCGKEAHIFKQSLITALLNCDMFVYDMGEGTQVMCRYACTVLNLDACMYINESDAGIEISVLGHDGNPIDDICERKIFKAYSLLKDKQQAFKKGSEEAIRIPLEKMYTSSLCRMMEQVMSGKDFSDFNINIIKNENSAIFETVFERMSGKIKHGKCRDGICVEISDDMQSLRITNRDISIDKNHAAAMVVKNMEYLGIEAIRYGNEVSRTVRNMAGVVKRKESDIVKIYDNVFYDATVAALLLLAVLKLRGEGPKVLLSEIPSFEIFYDEYVADINRGETMGRLTRLYSDSRNDSDDGICLSLSGGNVTVVPNRMKGFKIVSEAASMEMAKELAFKIGKAIKNEE